MDADTLPRPLSVRLDQGPLEGTWFTLDEEDGRWAVWTVVGINPDDPLWPIGWDFDDDDLDTLTVGTVNGWHHHYARTPADPGTWLYVATCHPESMA
jgi:hypothetical protein